MLNSSSHNEQELLAALKRGEQWALNPLFHQHYTLLLADVYRLIKDEDTCKDIAQEVFVELWNKRESLEVHTSLRAYLRRAVVNRALNFIKTSKRTVFEDDLQSWEGSGEEPDEVAEIHDRAESMENALRQAIDALPDKCRLVFSLSRFESMSHKEIAEKLGISVKTIENQITKAMKLLREALRKHAHLSPVVILLLKTGLFS
ncbi:MAG: RNA polymerase sigma-70 factor [Saprospiraceae bacterium]|nr:RNA polymerase sigma-70 factor [Saprospiraceae bacterium]